MPTFVAHNFILTLTLLPYVSFMFTDLNSCIVSSESLNGPKNQESDGDLTDDVFESHGEDFKVCVMFDEQLNAFSQFHVYFLTFRFNFVPTCRSHVSDR